MANPIVLNANVATPPGNVTPIQNTYALSSGITPQYQVILSVGGDEKLNGDTIFPIVAALPERYNISLSSNWDAPFSNKSIGDYAEGTKFGAGKGAAIDQLSSVLGIGTRDKYSLAQVWQSTSPLSFNLDFVFHVKTNTRLDIRAKHLALLKLVAPSEIVAGMLSAPGPNLISKAVSGRNITLQLGTYIRLDNIIVTSVSSDVQTLCGQDGIPHSVSINVEFQSFFAGMTTDDLESIFL